MKKLRSAAAAAISAMLIGCASVMNASAADELMLGDINNDAAINSKDASLMLSEYARTSTGKAPTFDEKQKNAADANDDGKIDSKDASLTLSYYAYIATGGDMTFPDYIINPPVRHSVYYVEGCSQDDMVKYFTEVVNDAEYSNAQGMSSLVQKWDKPIKYYIHLPYGTPTDKDRQVIEETCKNLNSLRNFPGISETKNKDDADIFIFFSDKNTFYNMMGESINYEPADGAVQYFFNKSNIITNAMIGIRNDSTQEIRNSVIVEEFVNGLGLSDTYLRRDSILYQYTSDATSPSDIDYAIIDMLYHSSIKPGMTAKQCEDAIRRIYY